MEAVELRRLLREARQGVKPGDVGLAPRAETRGRRVIGLGQSHMDTLLLRDWPAGTYGRLERGSLESPDPRLLDAVASVLGLDDHQRSTLYLYAGVRREPLPLDPNAPVVLGDHWQQALDGIEHMAYIVDLAWRPLCWNARFLTLFPPHPEITPGRPPSSIMWWIVLCRLAREEHFLDWETAWAPYSLAQLRTAVRQYPESQELQRLHRLVMADPVTEPIYSTRSVEYTYPEGDRRPMVHPDLGPGMVTMCPSYLPGSRAVLMIIPFEPGPVEPPRNHGRLRRGTSS